MSPPQQQNHHHHQHPNHHHHHHQNHRSHIVRVGGPHSRLPRFVESLFSWSLCLSCLSVSGYHYCISTYIKPLWSRLFYSNYRQLPAPGRERVHHFNGENRRGSHCSRTSWILTLPLTTHSRREMESKTVMERYKELCSYLSRVYNIHLVDHHLDDVDTRGTENLIIDILRKDIIARRLASLVMMGQWDGAKSNHRRRLFCGKQCWDVGRGGGGDGMVLVQGRGEYDQRDLPVLIRFLMSNWNRLLEFPPETEHISLLREYEFEVSLVVPSYGETTALLQRQMKKWYKHCKDPEKVEVILVDAGGRSEGRRNGPDDDCNDFLVMGGMDGLSDDSSWGCVRVLEYSGGGGRGSCLNYGAAAARGRILTFCHLDTTLPREWDGKVRNVLLGCGENVVAINGARDNHRGSGNVSRRGEEAIVRVNACAFGFGIDTSKEGLGNGPYPPGIRAVETTANIRTHLFVLPYGDQALSLTKAMFDFLGGFPDQCLMEDYELVVLLRKRAAFFKSPTSSFGYQEVLKIVPGEPALCSPRRWQKFGVLYVTFMNSKFINLYCGGLGPDQLYKLYYGCDPPKRKSELSPWEEELQKILSAND